MRAVRLPRAVADPEEMRRAGVAVAGGGIDPGQRLLVGQQQALVRGVEIGLPHLRQVGHAAGLHEAQRLVDPRRQVLVAGGQRAALDEAEVPAVHLVQVGIAAGGEGAQQVQRAGRLHVGEFHPRRVRDAGGGGEVRAVDDVAAIGGQRDAVHGLGVGRPRLGELPGHAAELHHRRAAAEGQHHGHLQQHPEGVADDVGGEVGEALGAVAALQHEGLALGRPRPARPSAAAPRRRRRGAAIAPGAPRPRPASPDRGIREPAGSACPASFRGATRARSLRAFPGQRGAA